MSLETGLVTYQVNMGQYPRTPEGGLRALFVCPPDDDGRWQGPYVDGDWRLKDGWGRDFLYLCPGRRNPDGYDLWSIGPDGVDGTQDDIGNWQR